MSREEEKDSEKAPKEENRSKADACVNYIILALCVIVCLFVLAFCTGMCSRDNDYDDRWDRLEHSVKTDPYYKQW